MIINYLKIEKPKINLGFHYIFILYKNRDCGKIIDNFRYKYIHIN